eukprot:Opistho-2@80214
MASSSSAGTAASASASASVAGSAEAAAAAASSSALRLATRSFAFSRCWRVSPSKCSLRVLSASSVAGISAAFGSSDADGDKVLNDGKRMLKRLGAGRSCDGCGSFLGGSSALLGLLALAEGRKHLRELILLSLALKDDDIVHLVLGIVLRETRGLLCLWCLGGSGMLVGEEGLEVSREVGALDLIVLMGINRRLVFLLLLPALLTLFGDLLLALLALLLRLRPLAVTFFLRGQKVLLALLGELGPHLVPLGLQNIEFLCEVSPVCLALLFAAVLLLLSCLDRIKLLLDLRLLVTALVQLLEESRLCLAQFVRVVPLGLDCILGSIVFLELLLGLLERRNLRHDPLLLRKGEVLHLELSLEALDCLIRLLGGTVAKISTELVGLVHPLLDLVVLTLELLIHCLLLGKDGLSCSTSSLELLHQLVTLLLVRRLGLRDRLAIRILLLLDGHGVQLLIDGINLCRQLLRLLLKQLFVGGDDLDLLLGHGMIAVNNSLNFSHSFYYSFLVMYDVRSKKPFGSNFLR